MNLAEGGQMGFIAQEVQAIFPELVHNNAYAAPPKSEQSKTGETTQYLGLDYISMIPVLTRAIQEQQTEIDTQDERIKSLEKENATIKARMDRLEALIQQTNK